MFVTSRQHPRVEAHVEAAAASRGEAAADLVVLPAQEGAAPQHEGHLRAEGAHDRAQLGRDVAPSEHQQALGEGVEPHDRVGGVVPAAGQAIHVGNGGPGSGRHHDPLRGDGLVSHRRRAGADEAGGVGVDGHVGQTLPVGEPALGEGVDPTEDPVANRGPVGAVEAGVNAQALGVGRQRGHLGGVHEHLGGDAAHVEAGAAEEAVLGDSDVPVAVLGPDHRIARARPDDQQVEATHRARHPSAGWRRPRLRGAVRCR